MHELNVLVYGPSSFQYTLNELKPFLKFNHLHESSKANFDIILFHDEVLNDKRNTLIIFPQGTRKDYKDRSKFKKGFARIYNDFQINCLPIAINSGKTWPKSSFLKSKQNITVSILKSFEPVPNAFINVTISLEDIIFDRALVD